MIRISISSQPRLLNIVRAVVKFCAQQVFRIQNPDHIFPVATDNWDARVVLRAHSLNRGANRGFGIERLHL